MADVEKDIVLRVKSETDQAQGQFKNLKQELKGIENELNRMKEAGDTGSKAFQELQKRAGQVKDQIGDTKNAIKALSSDTFKLDAFTQAAQGIAGGFAAAQGAMALFGSENKQVEEAIKKTQGAMALLQGVTAITNILQKETAFSQLFLSKAQKDGAVATDVATKATKGFGMALKGLGIGLLIGALTYLIANFEDVKKVVNNLIAPFDGIIAKVRDFLSTISFGLIDDASTAKTKANAETSLEAINKLTKANESIEKQMQRNIDIAKAKGNNDKEVLILEEKLLDFRLKNNYAMQDAIKKKIALNTATEDERKKLFELVQTARDTIKDREILEINYAKAQQKRDEEAEKKRQEQRRESNNQFFKDLGEIKTKEVDLIQTTAQEEQRSLFTLDDLRKESTRVDAELAEQRKQNKFNEVRSGLEMASRGFDALMSLTSAFTNQTEESQRKAFKINKAFQLSQALIQTYMAVTGALTAGGNPIKLATGQQFVEAGIALTAGLAQVAKIAKTQFGGGAQGAGSGMGGSGLGSVPTPSPMATQTNGLNATQLQLDAQGNLLQQRSVRTYVLETDISAKQQRSKRLQQTATLGK